MGFGWGGRGGGGEGASFFLPTNLLKYYSSERAKLERVYFFCKGVCACMKYHGNLQQHLLRVLLEPNIMINKKETARKLII